MSSFNRFVIVVVVLLLLFAGYLAYSYFDVFNIDPHCEVRIMSESDLIKVEVVDKELFKEFYSKFLSCNEDGKFEVGDPYNRSAPIEAGIIIINITDIPQSNTMKIKDEAMHTWSYDFSDNSQVTVRFSVTEDGLNLNRDKSLTFLIAARLSALANFDRSQNWLDRNMTINEFDTTVENSGLSYETL